MATTYRTYEDAKAGREYPHEVTDRRTGGACEHPARERQGWQCRACLHWVR